MGDSIDKAQAADLAHTQAALARHEVNRPKRESLKFCFTCGERIPEERRLAVPGCQRCIDCQELIERGMR